MKQLHKNMSINDLRRRMLQRSTIEFYAKAIHTLPAKKKLLFALYFIHGYRMKDIAELCGTYEYTISRRLKKIARELEEVVACVGKPVDACPHKISEVKEEE